MGREGVRALAAVRDLCVDYNFARDSCAAVAARQCCWPSALLRCCGPCAELRRIKHGYICAREELQMHRRDVRLDQLHRICHKRETCFSLTVSGSSKQTSTVQKVLAGITVVVGHLLALNRVEDVSELHSGPISG